MLKVYVDSEYRDEYLDNFIKNGINIFDFIEENQDIRYYNNFYTILLTDSFLYYNDYYSYDLKEFNNKDEQNFFEIKINEIFPQLFNNIKNIEKIFVKEHVTDMCIDYIIVVFKCWYSSDNQNKKYYYVTNFLHYLLNDFSTEKKGIPINTQSMCETNYDLLKSEASYKQFKYIISPLCPLSSNFEKYQEFYERWEKIDNLELVNNNIKNNNSQTEPILNLNSELSKKLKSFHKNIDEYGNINYPNYTINYPNYPWMDRMDITDIIVNIDHDDENNKEKD